MGFSLFGYTIFRDYETDGQPASGAHKILKSDVRAWMAAVEAGGAMLGGYADGARFTTNTDTPIPIALPPGFTRYRVLGVIVSGATGDLSAATVGLFTAAGGGGTAIVSTGSCTVSQTAEATNNNMQALTINNPNTQSWNSATLYFRCSTASAGNSNGNVHVFIQPLP